MRTAMVLLVTLLVLTPASVLAQSEKPPTSDLTITTWDKLDQQQMLRASINQRIDKFNVDIEQILRETREIKQFSRPYEVEFERWSKQRQHNPDREFQNLHR